MKIRVINVMQTGGIDRVAITSIMTNRGWNKVKSDNPKFVLKCKCGHFDFVEGGYIGFYECDGCGQEIQVAYDNEVTKEQGV